MDIQNLVPQEPITPVEPKQSWFGAHKALVYIVVVAIVVAAGVAGYFVMNSGKVNQSDLSPVAHKEKTDPTAAWKTYTNVQYGFSMKLPVGWVQNGEPIVSGDKTYGMINFASPSAQKNPKFSFYGGELNILVYQNPNSLSISNYFNGKIGDNLFFQPDNSSVKTKDIVVDSKQGKRFYDVEGESVVQIAIVLDNNRFIEIEDQSTPTVIDQILSTFKFSNTTVVTGTVKGHAILTSCSAATLNKTCFPPSDPFTKVSVTVQAIQNGKIVKSIVLDKNGDYTMELSPGTYGIDRDWPGYNAAHSPVIITVGAGDSAIVNFKAGIDGTSTDTGPDIRHPLGNTAP